MKLGCFIKETFADAIKALTSKEGVKTVYGVSLYRNATYLMMNSAITAALGFVFWLVAARFYHADAVGQASAIISAAAFIALVSTLGLEFGLIRFLPRSGERAGQLTNSCFTIGGLVSLVAAIIFILGLGIWSPALIFIQQNGIYFASFVAFTMAATLLLVLNHTFIAERHTGFILAQNTILSLLKIGLVILLAMFFHAFGIFASCGAATAIAIAVGVLLFLPRVQANYRPRLVIRQRVVNEILHYSFINYISNLLWIAPNLILPIMVVNMLSAEQNAYFYIAWAVGSLLAAIPMATSFSMFAEGSYDEGQLKYNIGRSLKLTLVLLLPAIILMLLIGDKLLLLFGAAYSQNGTRLLWVVAITALPMSINYIYLGVKRVEQRLKGVLALTLFVAAATLGLSYLVMPILGILGCGFAWLGSQGIAALMSSYHLKLTMRHK